MIEDQEYLAKLYQWKTVADQLSLLKTQEMVLRKELFAVAFEEPLEGTNKAELPGGWTLKGVYKLDRSIDEASFLAIKEKLVSVGVSTDSLVRYKIDLVLKSYKALSDATRAIMDQCLVTKPGAPSLELISPKE